MSKDLGKNVRNYLEIRALEEESDYDLLDLRTTSAEAFRYHLLAMDLWYKMVDRSDIIPLLTKAIEIDTNFVDAMIFLSYSYFDLVAWGKNEPENLKQARYWMQKAYQRKNNMPYKYQMLIEFAKHHK